MSWNFSFILCKTTIGDDFATKWACVLVDLLSRYDETHIIFNFCVYMVYNQSLVLRKNWISSLSVSLVYHTQTHTWKLRKYRFHTQTHTWKLRKYRFHTHTYTWKLRKYRFHTQTHTWKLRKYRFHTQFRIRNQVFRYIKKRFSVYLE